MDTIPGGKISNDLNNAQSTISRYACRIVVSRYPPYTARIYAAGFDNSKSIFLGVRSSSSFYLFPLIFFDQEKSIKWKTNRHEMDGVTTNGILLMHTDEDQFHSNTKSTKWKELSVGGNVFDLGEGRLKFNYQTVVFSQKKKMNYFKLLSHSIQSPSNIDNILKDGTLIDLCGATLLWRSIEGLKHTPVNRI